MQRDASGQHKINNSETCRIPDLEWSLKICSNLTLQHCFCQVQGSNLVPVKNQVRDLWATLSKKEKVGKSLGKPQRQRKSLSRSSYSLPGPTQTGQQLPSGMNSSSCCAHDSGGHGWGVHRTSPCVHEHTLHGEEAHSVPCWGKGEKEKEGYCQNIAFIWPDRSKCLTQMKDGAQERWRKALGLQGFTMFQVRDQLKTWIFFSFYYP